MKKLASIGDLPANEAEAVSAAQEVLQEASSTAARGAPGVSGSGSSGESSGRQTASKQMVFGPVRRVRSHHHRHRRFRMERLEEIRHREDFRALAFILPLITLLIGIVIIASAYRSPDPSMRPDKLVSLAWVFVAIGGGWFFVSTCIGAWRSWKEARKRAQEEREDAAANSEWNRRSSHRRRHRHHHRSDGSSSYSSSFSRRQAVQTAADGDSSTPTPAAPAGGES